MSKYLDETGLVELWEKIKDRSISIKPLSQNDYDDLSLPDKQKEIVYLITSPEKKLYFKDEPISGSGATISIGKTLIENDGTIDVAIPVNGIVTQEAFDELSTDERNNGVWVIQGITPTGALTGVTLEDAISQLYGSLADAKKTLAEAISSKGVETSEDSTFQQMAKNVSKIQAMSGSVDDITDPEEFYQYDRPSDWLPMPQPNDDEIYLLFQLPKGHPSQVAFTITTTEGPYTVEVGTVEDGEFVPRDEGETVPSGTKFEAEWHSSEFGNETSIGHTQCIIKISGTGIKSFIHEQHSKITRSSVYKNWNIVEFLGKLPSCTSLKCGHSSANGALGKLRYFRLIGEASLTTAADMFSYCYGLRAVIELDVSKAISVASLFQYCRSLQAIPKVLNTSKAEGAASLFNGCMSLKAIPPWIDMSNFTNISYFVQECSSLRYFGPTLNCPRVDYANSTFSGCYQLTKVGPISFKRCSSTNNLFSSCGSMKEVLFDPETTGWSGSDIDLRETIMSYEGLIALLNSLPTLTTSGKYRLQLPYTNTAPGNPVSQLTEDDLDIARNKGWNVIASA